MILKVKQTDTEYKLTEAKFFLGHLRKNKRKLDEFNFYFNAFISAARSVYWIMVREYENIDGWRAWQKTKEHGAPDTVKDLLKRTRHMRNCMVKDLGSLVSPMIIVAANREVQRLCKGGHFILTNKETGEKIRYRLGQVVPIRRIEPKFFPQIEILKESELYYKVLSRFVKECVVKFGRPLGKELAEGKENSSTAWVSGKGKNTYRRPLPELNVTS